jgi:hypothetical protein
MLHMLSVIAAATIILQGKGRTPPIAPFQPQTPVAWNPQGAIKSDDLKQEHRDANGNVEGTEFFHLEYEVSTRLVDLPPGLFDITNEVVCNNACKGKKHKKHEACDSSCDELCKQNHTITIKGGFDELRDQEDMMERESAKLAQKGAGGAGAPDWSSAVSHALRDAKRDAEKQKLTMTPAHIVKPCTRIRRYYGVQTKEFQVHCVLKKVGYYMTHGQRTPIDQEVGTQDGVVAYLYYPKKDPIFSDEFVACACRGEEQPEQPPTEGGIPGEGKKGTPTYSGLGWQKPDGTIVIPEHVKVTGKGKDLNEAEIDVENDEPYDLIVTVYAGIILVSEDGDIQTMVVMQTITTTVGAGSTARLYASARPEPDVLSGVIKPRVACTQMTKHQPDENTRFKVMDSGDDHLKNICAQYERTRIHTGADQGRVWIYTDHATLEEINKRLFPRMSPGQYLNAMAGVAEAGIDLEDGAYKRCVDIELLEGSTASQAAVDWYVRFWEQHDLKAISNYAKRLVGLERTTLAGGDRSDVNHAADLAFAFLGSSEGSIRSAGLSLLAAVPEDKRGAVKSSGGLKRILNGLRSDDEAEVLAALAVVEQYKDSSVANYVAGLASWSSSAAVKAKAKSVGEALN